MSIKMTSGKITVLKAGYRTILIGLDKFDIDYNIIEEYDKSVKIRVGSAPAELLEGLFKATEEYLQHTTMMLDIASKILLIRTYSGAKAVFNDPESIELESTLLEGVANVDILRFIISISNAFMYTKEDLDEDAMLALDVRNALINIYTTIKIPCSPTLKDYLCLDYDMSGLEDNTFMPKRKAGTLVVQGPGTIQ